MAFGPEAPILDPGYVNAQLGTTTPTDPAAPLSALSGLTGGAKQWVAGPQKEGTLVFNAGNVYRVKQDIANAQAAPTVSNGFYTKLPVYEDLAYVRVGPNPTRYNASLGPLDPSTTLLDSAYYNVFGFGIQNVTLGANAFANTFGSVQNGHVLGSTFEQNTFGADLSDVRFGTNCRYNTLGSNISIVRAGNGCEANILASSVNNVTLGDNTKACRVGPGCQYVSLGAGCERVELYNCTGTSGASFVIPAGSKDQVWRNNMLVGTGSGTPGTGTARDPFAVGDVASITDAVLDLSNTWVDGDLTAYGSSALQTGGAPPAEDGQNASILVGAADVATMDEFDKRDANGFAWRCRYSRRNDGTSGWTRLGKTA